MTDMKRELFCTIFKREVVHAEKNHQATGEEEEEVVHLTGDQLRKLLVRNSFDTKHSRCQTFQSASFISHDEMVP